MTPWATTMHDDPSDFFDTGAEHLAGARSYLEDEGLRALRAQLEDHLEGYELREVLGRGGMGAVFRARQLRLERDVAIKVLVPPTVAPDGWQERFLREARALARLSHPGVVAVHDFDQRGELAWIVMEYVDGTSLRDLLEGGRLTPEEALAIVPGICAALQFAHDQGVVHRDVKPENVLLDRQGNVKLADFGLAKLVRDSEAPGLTRSDQAMGTPRYMAPEQLDRPRDVDHRADIFALGLVFYEMLTGEVPRGVIEPPSRRVEVDVRLDEVVLRSLEQHPERRFQRASEVGDRVEAIRHGGEPATEADVLQQAHAAESAPASPPAPPPAPEPSAEVTQRDPGEAVGRRFDIAMPLLVLWGGLIGSAFAAGEGASRSWLAITLFLHVGIHAIPFVAREVGSITTPGAMPFVRSATGLSSIVTTGLVSVFSYPSLLTPGGRLVLTSMLVAGGAQQVAAVFSRLGHEGPLWQPLVRRSFAVTAAALAMAGGVSIFADVPSHEWGSSEVVLSLTFLAFSLLMIRGAPGHSVAAADKSRAIWMATAGAAAPLAFAALVPFFPGDFSYSLDASTPSTQTFALACAMLVGVLGGILGAGTVHRPDEPREARETVVTSKPMSDDEPMILRDGLNAVEVAMIKDLLESEGIPSVTHSPDFDMAELGKAAHQNLRGTDLYVPPAAFEKADELLKRVWDPTRELSADSDDAEEA